MVDQRDIRNAAAAVAAEGARAALVYDPRTERIVAANEAAAALYDLDLDALEDAPLESLYAPSERSHLREMLDRVKVKTDGAYRRAGVLHRRSGGTELRVDIENHPLDGPSPSLRLLRISPTAEEDLSTALGRRSLLFRAMDQPVVILDGGGAIADWNPAAEALWGHRRAEAVGRPFTWLLDSDDADLEILLETLRWGQEWAGLLNTRSSRGDRIVCRARVVPTIDVSGSRLLAAVAVFTDMTREHEVEQALAESAGDFHVLADQIPHIVWMADRQGRTYYLNRRWRALTGQSEDEGLVAGWVDRLHPGDQDRTTEAWKHSIEHGEEFSLEHRILSLDGSYRWFLSRGTPIHEDGEVTRWIGSSVDIHLQKEAEDEARRRERYFRDMFEAAHDAIVLFDRRTGRVVDVNPEAERMYGYPRDTFLTLDLSDLFPTAQAAQELIEELMQPMRAPRQLSQIDARGDPIHVEVNAAPMQFEQRPVLLTFNRDLTERRQLQLQLQQAQKMEAVGRLAGGLAHDFNNLTTAIKGFASLLAEQLEGDHRAQESLAEINGAADRASELTRQLLAYTRQSVMRAKVINLNEVVRSSHQLLKRLIGADIAFEVDLDSELSPVRADPVQVQQILMNLVVNARDAMPEGGRLLVQTANTVLESDFTAERPPLEPGPYVRLCVQDSGVGMAEETRIHAFEPFYTTKGVGEGTGLGLATVYGIVKQSGGFIWVDSEPGEGSRFDIYLPPVDEPVEATASAAVSEQIQETPDGARILLVEDEPAVRKLSRRVLERAGFDVLEAEDGIQAASLLEKVEGPIDLVLTDMVMPRMSGKELAQRVTLTRPGTPILFMSGYTGESLAERGDLEKEDVVIEKPFEPARLVSAVKEMLETSGG